MFHVPGRNNEIEAPDFEVHETPSGWVFENHEPMVIGDWHRETRFPQLREYFKHYDIRSSCVLPLTTAHRRLGVFATGVTRPDAYSGEEVQFLSVIADHLALTLDEARASSGKGNRQHPGSGAHEVDGVAVARKHP